MVGKFSFGRSETALSKFKKTNSPIIYDVMVECHYVLKRLLHQLSIIFANQKRLVPKVFFVHNYFFSGIFLKKAIFWPQGYFSPKKLILINVFFFSCLPINKNIRRLIDFGCTIHRNYVSDLIHPFNI